MITIALLLMGCMHLDCRPTGRILWSGVIPRHFAEIPTTVDGAMGGLRCDYKWTR